MATERDQQTGVLFVCMGNICRSPLAECVFRHKVKSRGVQGRFLIDSAGTGDWHVGASPDHRARACGHRHGVEVAGCGRQVTRDDFKRFDHILCMDQENLAHLLRIGAPRDRTRLLLEHDPATNVREVPDPYYGGADGFETVFRLVDAACESLLDHLLRNHRA